MDLKSKLYVSSIIITIWEQSLDHHLVECKFSVESISDFPSPFSSVGYDELHGFLGLWQTLINFGNMKDLVGPLILLKYY